MNTVILERDKLSESDCWALSDLYPDATAWKSDFAHFKKLIAAIPAYAGRISQSADALLEYMKLTDEMSVLCDRLANYAQRKLDEDTRISENQALTGAILSACVEAGEASNFEAPEILSISDEMLAEFYTKRPELRRYDRVFFNIRRKRTHILPPEGEKLLAAAGEMAESPEKIYALFSDADLKFRDAADGDGRLHSVTHGTYTTLMESEDRVLRKNAFFSIYDTFGVFRNSLAAMLSAQMKQEAFFAKARRYASPLEASLSHNHVPTSVYDHLIDAVHRNLPKLHRYIALRKRVLRLRELHAYDLYTPLVSGIRTDISFDEAKNTVEEALRPLGEQYGEILREGFRNRWIDVYETVGKRSGAYSAGARIHPYILLNYKGTLDGAFTLAHEMGHAIHSYLSNRHQPVAYADYVIFVAEVASTCNEALLMEHLLEKTKERKKRAYLINHFLEQFRATLYRQTMFAEFERLLGEHVANGIQLTADVLCAEYEALNRLYYGDELVLDPGLRMEWARIPHFYYNYYVFQYATGYAAAISISRRILREGAPAVRDYLAFLSSGSSRDPIDLLRDAGVDMTTDQPIEDALSLFSELLDEMEALMEDA